MRTSCGIPDGWVFEILRHALRRLLEGTHVRRYGGLQLFGTAHGGHGMHAGFQIAVQILIGIQLGRVRRQVEYLDLFGMVGEPGLDDLGVMHAQVVKNQKYLAPLRSSYQPLEKLDQHLRVQCAVIDHPANQSLVGHRGDHVDRGVLRRQTDDRGASLRRIAPAVLAITTNARLITPVNLRLLLLCSLSNGRILLLHPTRDGSRLLLVGPFEWFLWGKTPALQIMTDGAHRHADAKPLSDQLADGLSCPQREVELELVWGLVNDAALDFRLLLGREGTVHPACDAAALRCDCGDALDIVLPAPAGYAVAIGTDDSDDFRVRLPLLVQADCLPAQLLLRLRSKCACVLLFHAAIYNISNAKANYIMAGLIILQNNIYCSDQDGPKPVIAQSMLNANDTLLIVAYKGSDGLYYIQSTNAGRSWDNTKMVNNTKLSSRNQSIAANDKHIMLVYQEDDTTIAGRTNIIIQDLKNNGFIRNLTTWYNNIITAEYPSIDLYHDIIYLTWTSKMKIVNELNMKYERMVPNYFVGRYDSTYKSYPFTCSVNRWNYIESAQYPVVVHRGNSSYDSLQTDILWSVADSIQGALVEGRRLRRVGLERSLGGCWRWWPSSESYCSNITTKYPTITLSGNDSRFIVVRGNDSPFELYSEMVSQDFQPIWEKYYSAEVEIGLSNKITTMYMSSLNIELPKLYDQNDYFLRCMDFRELPIF
jgi:hypothetical protein